MLDGMRKMTKSIDYTHETSTKYTSKSDTVTFAFLYTLYPVTKKGCIGNEYRTASSFLFFPG